MPPRTANPVFGREVARTSGQDARSVIESPPGYTATGNLVLRVGRETDSEAWIRTERVVLSMDESRELTKQIIDTNVLDDDSLAEIVDACLKTLNDRAGDVPQSPDDSQREDLLDEREAGLKRVCDAWDEIREDYRGA